MANQSNNQIKSRTKQTDSEEFQTPNGLEISKVIGYLTYAWVYLGIFTLTLRTFLLATSANLGNGFSNFIMRTSADFLRPFRGIFPQAQVSETGYLDVSAIFAIIIYLFVAWGAKTFIDYVNTKIKLNLQQQKQVALQNQLDNQDLEITAVRKKQ